MGRKIDLWILLSLGGLSIFSLFNIFGIDNQLFSNHLIFFAVGIFFAATFYKLGLRFFRLNAGLFYFISLFFLIATFIIGEQIRGSRRWISFYFFNFQTSEFLKLFFVIYLADFFSKKEDRSKKKWVASFFIFLLPIFLIFKQPDLGNSIVYTTTFLAILFFSGIPLRYFIKFAAVTLISTPVLWHFLADYQKKRIISFLNPNLDPSGISYNLVQSIITVGSGGFLGRGLGRGTQSKFLFLPENHTDFVFGSLAEQFGFIGGASVITLYGIIIYRLTMKAQKFKGDQFNFLFLIGVIFILISEVVVNIGMNLGLMPLTGIALPFLSYGGSSVVTSFMLLALAISL